MVGISPPEVMLCLSIVLVFFLVDLPVPLEAVVSLGPAEERGIKELKLEMSIFWVSLNIS